MDATTKKLVSFLDFPEKDLRLSSLRVLSELGDLKGEALKSVKKILEEGDIALNRSVLNVLAAKPSIQLVEFYIPFLKDSEGGKEIALRALETLGAPASQLIQKEYKGTTDDSLKRSFITLLTRIPSRSNFDFISKVILDEMIDIQKHITYEIHQNAARYSEKDKKLFEGVVRESLRHTDKSRNVEAATAFVIILGELALKSSLNILMRYTEPKRTKELRHFALASIAKLPLTGKIDESIQKALLMYLSEPDYANVVQDTLNILEPILGVRKFEKIYLELMTTNPHNPVKNFALGKLAQLNSKAALERLTSQLIGGDSFLYEKAQKVLEQSEQGFNYLLKRLDEISTPEAAERVGGLLAVDRSRIKATQIAEMFRKTEKSLKEPGMRSRIYFTLLKRLDPDYTYENTLKKVAQFKSSKKFEEARALLNLLSSTLLFNQDAKFEYAVVQLKLSKKNIDSSYRDQDPALPMFQSLVPQKNFGLIERIKKEKIMGAEEVFYLGYHFSEKLFDQKDFGVQLLKHVLKKFPSSPYAKKARKKLEVAGGSYTPTVSKGR